MGDNKAGTTAERCVWMTRTSDVLGSHVKTDLDSYLTLIRRKIHEKCATTVELIQQIRRNKVSDSAHVTPNEFRFTLIKFGIILDQSLVDRIFVVFDSDRSGTMDFDEFAMWIMNSEFQPKEKTLGVQKGNGDSPRTVLRKKFLICVNEHSKAFANMKKQISIIDFVSEISRKNMKINEREARSVFQELDPEDTGYVETAKLVKYAKSGVVDLNATRPAQEFEQGGSLEELLRRIVGRNTMALEKAFSHVKRGASTKVPFEEFRRCLLNAGVGKNIKDVKQLYQALGGQSSAGADIDLFFNSLMPIVTDARTEISTKKGPSPSVNLGRADRTLRNAMRKSFNEVKAECEVADASKSGFISSVQLYSILIKTCCPLTMQDYRFIMQELGTDPDSDTHTTRVDYKHFLHSYNPLKAPHMLSGYQTLKEYDGSPSKTDSSSAAPMSKKFEAFLGMDSSKPGGPPSARMAKSSSESRYKASAGGSGRIGTAYTSNGGIGSNGTNKELLKKVWQSVLRKCHSSDPTRSGNVSRIEFIAALESANFGKGMSPESMNRLADGYTQPNGLVNYLMCFRSYLGDLSSSKTIKALNASGSGELNLNLTKSPSKTLKPLPTTATHPWEFDYKRDKHAQGTPAYWNAASNPKDFGKWSEDILAQKSVIPPPNEKLTLTDGETKLLLVQNKPEVQEVCGRVYKLLIPSWRSLRAELKENSIKNMKGCTLTSKFLAILENNNVSIPKSDMKVILIAFRGSGITDVVKYDEFLRMCLVLKDQ